MLLYETPRGCDVLQVVVPGSHHARIPLPSNDSGDPAGHKRVLHPKMRAGDLLLFMGGATTYARCVVSCPLLLDISDGWRAVL